MAKRRPKDSSRRVQTDEIIKAAAHPTRQTILKSLKGRSLSTTDLEARTGENRYNLYHHLAKLQDAGLIEYRLEDGRAKVYSLAEKDEARESFFQLDRGQASDRSLIRTLLEALSAAVGDSVPDANEVETVTLMIRYREEKDRLRN